MIRRARVLLRMRTIERDRARAAVARARAKLAHAHLVAERAAEHARDLAHHEARPARDFELARATLTGAQQARDGAEDEAVQHAVALARAHVHVRRSERIVERLLEATRAAARHHEQREQDDRPPRTPEDSP